MTREQLQAAHDDLKAHVDTKAAELRDAKHEFEKQNVQLLDRDRKIEDQRTKLKEAERLVDVKNAEVRECQEKLTACLDNRKELVDANNNLKQEYDLLVQRLQKQPHQTVYDTTLELITGETIQRLFHNPTAPAMREAAGLITEKVLSL